MHKWIRSFAIVLFTAATVVAMYFALDLYQQRTARFELADDALLRAIVPKIELRHATIAEALDVMLMSLVPVALFEQRWSKLRGRRKRGLCQQCGYDLRYSPQRCPECGEVPWNAPDAMKPMVVQEAHS